MNRSCAVDLLKDGHCVTRRAWIREGKAKYLKPYAPARQTRLGSILFEDDILLAPDCNITVVEAGETDRWTPEYNDLVATDFVVYKEFE